jgi:sugar/nucleoside kinase (ribokinase family)
MDIAIAELKDVARHLNITLGAAGCLVVSQHSRTTVGGYSATALDTTGAGDMYAGGCLYGWTQGMSPEEAAALGNFAAARLVEAYGARLRTSDSYRETFSGFQSTPR